MFEKLLIANRGEIACRVIATARRLGIRTVAIYSDADTTARHVELADEAYPVGAAPAVESYLRPRRIIEVARASGAQAIHPGYGFLAENAAFARACARAGLVFVGPPAKAIRAMGSKSRASGLMEKAGVSVLPGYRGADQTPAALRRAAASIGYPVLVKPALGGGGKGMVRVERSSNLRAALATARRVSQSAFGDDRLVIEKFLDRCRHIEVQVFADTHGNALHLFERDCSIQRRHQKIIEEAPAPGVTPALRQRMGEAALMAARAVGYVGAGTVEFLADISRGLRAERFYFVEMNTRLQVEHPVTEMITGQDLVEWQLRIAAGEKLPCRQDDLRIRGHALEARIYAEDPDRDFVPAAGTLRHVRWPAAGKRVRIDTGVEEGDEIGTHYDPMIAKLIVHGRSRADALGRFKRSLADIRIAGVSTNIPFLARLAGHPAFAKARLSTDFIEHHRRAVLPGVKPVSDRILALAALDELLRRGGVDGARSDPHSPWNASRAWRLNADALEVLRFRDAGRDIALVARFTATGGYLLELPHGTLDARAARDGAAGLIAELGGTAVTAAVWREGERIGVMTGIDSHTLTLRNLVTARRDEAAIGGTLAAPMPGRVIEVKARTGARVKKGAPLVVVEAMKMEHTIVAPTDGTVERVNAKAGDLVDEGAQLIDFRSEREG